MRRNRCLDCEHVHAEGTTCRVITPAANSSFAPQCGCRSGAEPDECEGHESLDGRHMGETVFCDGRCVTR